MEKAAKLEAQKVVQIDKNTISLGELSGEIVPAIIQMKMLSFPASFVFDLLDFSQKIQSENQKYVDARNACILKHCILDENKQSKQENGRVLFPSPEIEKTCADEIIALATKKITLPLLKFPKSEIMTCGKVSSWVIEILQKHDMIF